MSLSVLEVFYFWKSGDLRRTVLCSSDTLHEEKGDSHTWANKLKILS